MAVVLLLGGAVPGENVQTAVNESRRNVVLSGKGIAAGDVHFRAARSQNAAQIRGFRLKVNGKGDLDTRKGLFGGKFLLDTTEQGHICLYPLYFGLAAFPKVYVSDFA